jgi:hypothetical protein
LKGEARDFVSVDSMLWNLTVLPPNSRACFLFLFLFLFFLGCWSGFGELQFIDEKAKR